MNERLRWGLIATAVVMGSGVVDASSHAATPDLCISSAYGVPSRYGPPRWGLSTAWVTGHAYAVGDEITNTSTAGTPSIYRCITAGTSAGAGAGPSTFAPDITDGSAHWRWIGVVDDSINDPRWLLASGKNFQFTETGAAQVPLKTRALYFDEATGQRYLYLSFVVNITPLPGGGAGQVTNPRDVYLAIRPPLATASPTGTAETSYLLRFHLDGTAVMGAPNLKPGFCNSDTACAAMGNYWRMYVQQSAATSTCYDPGYPGKCAIGLNVCNSDADCTTAGDECDAQGAKFIAPPSPTMAFPDGVRMWKLGVAGPGLSVLDNNAWAVEMRIPMVDTSKPNYGKCTNAGTACASDGDCSGTPGSTCKTSLRDGIPWSSASGAAAPQIWYELTADVGPSGVVVPRTMISSWPRGSSHVCVDTGTANTLVVPSLETATTWSKITMFDAFGAVPSGCEGIYIRDIGSVFNPPSGTDYTSAAVTPGYEIKAYSSGTTPAPNEIVARIQNSKPVGSPAGSNNTTANFIARFRLANWGTQPFTGGWGTTDIGTFDNMRGAKDGICASGGGGPTCGNVTATENNANIVAMHFPFQIGGLPSEVAAGTVDKSEYCKYGITPPGTSASCVACTCGADCDAAGDTGVRASVPADGTTYKCVSQRVDHQCMLVEIDAPNSDVDFVKRSSWNNMEFRATSKIAQTAMIDVRGLPKRKDQSVQDVYLIVMPRNMPETISPALSTVDLIRQRTDAAIDDLARPYLEDLRNLPPEGLLKVRDKLHRPVGVDMLKNVGAVGGNGYGGGSGSGSNGGDEQQRKPNENELRLLKAAEIMPDDDYVKARALLRVALTPDGPGQAELVSHRVVDLLGPTVAANLLPTLDIYSFYRIDRPTAKGEARYAPMTSFSVFLFHDQGPVQGIRWEIDGFQKVGENIFHQTIPVDRARKIQIRAASLEPNEPPPPPGNPRWPCGCCGGPNCGTMAGLSNMGPGLIAGVFVLGRRRKRKPASAAPRA